MRSSFHVRPHAIHQVEISLERKAVCGCIVTAATTAWRRRRSPGGIFGIAGAHAEGVGSGSKLHEPNATSLPLTGRLLICCLVDRFAEVGTRLDSTSGVVPVTVTSAVTAPGVQRHVDAGLFVPPGQCCASKAVF